MTQEEKELLLKDLCARLPYNVYIEITDNRDKEATIYTEIISCAEIDMFMHDEKLVRPYLRPMSSMTEEEKEEFKKIVYDSMNIDNISASAYVADWLYSKHLDVHGLIPKGLALEAPEGMYNIKNK